MRNSDMDVVRGHSKVWVSGVTPWSREWKIVSGWWVREGQLEERDLEDIGVGCAEMGRAFQRKQQCEDWGQAHNGPVCETAHCFIWPRGVGRPHGEQYIVIGWTAKNYVFQPHYWILALKTQHVRNKELEVFFYFSNFIFDPVLLCKTLGRMILCFFTFFPTPLTFLYTKTSIWAYYRAAQSLWLLAPNIDLNWFWKETLKVSLPSPSPEYSMEEPEKFNRVSLIISARETEWSARMSMTGVLNWWRFITPVQNISTCSAPLPLPSWVSPEGQTFHSFVLDQPPKQELSPFVPVLWLQHYKKENCWYRILDDVVLQQLFPCPQQDSRRTRSWVLDGVPGEACCGVSSRLTIKQGCLQLSKFYEPTMRY